MGNEKKRNEKKRRKENSGFEAQSISQSVSLRQASLSDPTRRMQDEKIIMQVMQGGNDDERKNIKHGEKAKDAALLFQRGLAAASKARSSRAATCPLGLA